MDGIVRVALKVAVLGNRNLVLHERLVDSDVQPRPRGPSLGRRSIVLLLGGELFLRLEHNRNVEERRTHGNRDAVLVEGVDGLLSERERDLEVGPPDDMARDETERQDNLGRLGPLDGGIERLGCTVEAGDRELGDGLEICVDASMRLECVARRA